MNGNIRLVRAECHHAGSGETVIYMLEDPGSISRALKLIFIAKHLERVADHSVNTAEMVVFLVRGEDIRHGMHLAHR